MRKIEASRIIATWFGCGLVPLAPGTAGSAAAIILGALAAAAFSLGGWQIMLLGLLLFPISVWAAGETARVLNSKDPGLIVSDEVVGQWITLGGAVRLNWRSWIFAFVLFRLFDVWKPFPIRRLEQLPGGLGITADDGLAGVYAAIVLYLLGRLNFY